MTTTETAPVEGEMIQRNVRVMRTMWEQSLAKVKRMSRSGWLSPKVGGKGLSGRLTVTDIVCAALETFLAETDAETATRLGLHKGRS